MKNKILSKVIAVILVILLTGVNFIFIGTSVYAEYVEDSKLEAQDTRNRKNRC